MLQYPLPSYAQEAGHSPGALVVSVCLDISTAINNPLSLPQDLCLVATDVVMVVVVEGGSDQDVSDFFLLILFFSLYTRNLSTTSQSVLYLPVAQSKTPQPDLKILLLISKESCVESCFLQNTVLL